MWRKGWVDRVDNKGQEIRVSLCNACGLLWKRGWFCVHCECVYRKEDEKHKEEGAAAAGEMWIGCEYCENFSHFECEKNIEDAETILGMDTYACPECRMKVVLACAGEGGGALPKFFDVKDTEMAKKTLGEPRKTRLRNGEKDKSEKKTGMKKVGKRMIHQRPFLRTSRSAGGRKKGVEKNLALIKNRVSPPGVNKNSTTKRTRTLSAKKEEDEGEDEDKGDDEKTTTKIPPKRKKWTKEKTEKKVSKKAPKKTKVASPKKKKSKAVTPDEEDKVGNIFDDCDAFALWSMKPRTSSMKTALALQRAKQSLEDECIRLDAIKKHEASLLGGTEDTFGDRALFATEHEKVFSESSTEASKTSSAPTLEASGATISIFDDMLPATENRPQDRVLDSAEKILKYARDCIEKAVDDHWALVKQQKGNDERNNVQVHNIISTNTRQNTQQHAFKPILNAKMALQKITSEPTLKKSLHSSSIKEKNAIIERSKIKYTLRGILHTFGNGREILESLSKLGGFWMTLTTEFLNEINESDAACASKTMTSVDPSKSMSLHGRLFVPDVKKRAEAATAAALKHMHKVKDIVDDKDGIKVVSSSPKKIICPVPQKVVSQPKLYPTGGLGFILNGGRQMVPRIRTTTSKHDSLFPPQEMFDSEMYEDDPQSKSIPAPDASWGSPLREYFDMDVNEGEQLNISDKDNE